MGITPPNESSEQPDAVPAALIPDILDSDTLSSQISPDIASLTTNQRRVLVALCENMLSESILTDSEIATELGFDRKTIYTCRQNPTFARCLSAICIDIIRGTSDNALRNLMKHSERDTKATEIWLRIANIYQPTNRNLNVNANISAQGAIGSSQQAIDQTIGQYISVGYTLDRFIEEVRERWQTLKAEGI